MVRRSALPLAVLSFVLCCRESDRSDVLESSSGGAPVEPTAAQLFAVHCALCHGIDAEGGELGPQIRNPVDGLASWVIRNGRDDMPFAMRMAPLPVEVVSDDELAAILEHLESFEIPSDGEGLYLRFCGNCHGADGLGGRVGVDVVHEAAEDVDEIVEAVRDGAGGTDLGARTEYMPAWSADAITDDEIAAIAAWLATLPPTRGDD
jgi:ubiquinol-cytochrome c reductase cytochrome c subunit